MVANFEGAYRLICESGGASSYVRLQDDEFQKNASLGLMRSGKGDHDAGPCHCL